MMPGTVSEIAADNLRGNHVLGRAVTPDLERGDIEHFGLWQTHGTGLFGRSSCDAQIIWRQPHHPL